MANSVNLLINPINLNQELLVDTNVLIFLFDPNTTDDKGYSFFLNDALSNGCKLYINSQIISEYINAVCKSSYYLYLRNNSMRANQFRYKQYRNTVEFKEVYQEAVQTLTDEILPIFEVIPIKQKHVSLSLDFNGNVMDYNDAIHIIQAEDRELSVVSHDSDIINYSGDITVYHCPFY